MKCSYNTDIFGLAEDLQKIRLNEIVAKSIIKRDLKIQEQSTGVKKHLLTRTYFVLF